MSGLQRFTVAARQPEQTVDFGVDGGTVTVVGGTVYYRDEPGVTAAVNDGSIADGGSAILFGTQFFATVAARADGQVRLSDLGGSNDRGGSAFAAMGDSIVGNGFVAGSGWTGRSWLAWAMLKSSGRIRVAGHFGTSGYTTAQILATHLPQVLAARPTACVVLAGTNDAGQQWNGTTVTWASLGTFQNLTAMYARLRAAGIRPIAATVPPGNTSANIRKATSELNAWIKRHAEINGYDLVDFHSILIDPATGGYLAGLSTDQIHPTSQGAERMGHALNDQIAARLPQLTSWLPGDNADGTSGVTNPCMLVDTNLDGVPDGWVAAGAEGTPTLVTDSEFVGKAFDIDHPTGTGVAQWVTSATLAVSAGDVIRLAVRVKILSLGASGLAQFYVADQTQSALDAFPRLHFDYAPAAMAAGVYVMEAVVPQGVTAVMVRGGIRSDTGRMRFGQVGLFNLTAKGLTV